MRPSQQSIVKNANSFVARNILNMGNASAPRNSRVRASARRNIYKKPKLQGLQFINNNPGDCRLHKNGPLYAPRHELCQRRGSILIWFEMEMDNDCSESYCSILSCRTPRSSDAGSYCDNSAQHMCSASTSLTGTAHSGKSKLRSLSLSPTCSSALSHRWSIQRPQILRLPSACIGARCLTTTMITMPHNALVHGVQACIAPEATSAHDLCTRPRR